MTSEQKAVKNFMKAFGQATPNSPTVIDEQTAKLRAALILEEALETITKGLGIRVSIGNIDIDKENFKQLDIKFYQSYPIDLVELADGLGDLHVVGYCGTGCAAGIDMEEIFKEIDRSNNSKLWDGKDIQQGQLNNPGSTIHPSGPNKWILRRADGKIIKSPNYSPANIEKYINKQIKKAEIKKKNDENQLNFEFTD